MWKFKVYIALSILICHQFAGAEIKLSELPQKIKAQSPKFALIQAQSQKAESSLREAWTQLIPSLEFVFGGQYQDQPAPSAALGGFSSFISPDEVYNWKIRSQWSPYLGGRIWKTLKLREKYLEQSKIDSEYELNELVKQSLEIWVRAYSVLKSMDILKESQAAQEKYLKITKRRARRGDLESFELSQVKADYYSYSPRLANYSKQLNLLKAQWLSLVGEEAQDEDFKLRPNLAPVENLKPGVSLAVQKLQFSEEVLQISQAVENSKYLPKLVLNLSYGAQTYSFLDTFDPDFWGYSLGAQVSWTFYQGGERSYKKKSWEMDRIVIEKQKQDINQKLKLSENLSQEEIQKSQLLVEQSEKWVNMAQRALHQAQRAYQIGRVSSFQILQLRNSLERAQESLNQAQVGEVLGKINFVYAKGYDLSQWVSQTD